MKRLVVSIVLPAVAIAFGTAFAQNVKVTSLGSHNGELCNRDRATIFEDPTGVRILYDAGQTVLGADDERLGKLDVVLVSHAHGDHIGDQKLKAIGAGTCDTPQLVPAGANSTSAEIAAAKSAALVVVIPLGNFLGRKIEAIRGKPTGNCPTTGEDLVAPLAAPCLATVHVGGTRTIKASPTAKAVEIVGVPAVHDSALPLSLMSEALRKSLDPDNLSQSAGPPIGYVIRFSNGLTAYLTGDTGLHAEMQTVVHGYYKANLIEINLGPNAIDPRGAAHVVNTLVQPAAVILSHVNEAGTSGGKVREGSRSAAFIALVKDRPVHPALSGKTMEFDGAAKCVAGC